MQALEVLQPIYDWFTEGFDFPDLTEAKTQLESIRTFLNQPAESGR
jgi:hypothetical protein